VQFTDDYAKAFYDVRLNGRAEIIKHCWPNAGKMMAQDGSGREWWPGECLVRLSPDHPLEGAE